MTFTAKTVQQLRQEGGSLLKKIATELGLIAARINLSGDMTVTDAGVATIADDAVTAAKADVFMSSEVTSNGSAKNTAHGLGATPSVYFAIAQEFGTSQNPNISCAADATNIAVTAASTDVKYIVFAWL